MNSPSPRFRWLRSLTAALAPSRRTSAPSTGRRIRLEQLEARNLLATILDVEDISVRVPYSNDASIFIVDAHDAVVAYDNDNDSFPGLIDRLHVVEFNGEPITEPRSEDVPLPDTDHLISLQLIEGHNLIQYTPAPGYTGTDTFTFVLSDSSITESNPLFSDLVTVTIEIYPNTSLNLESSIDEGDGITLHDLVDIEDEEPIHRTQAPGPLTYSWYIDANEDGEDAFDSGYAPNASDLVVTGTANTVPTVNVDWNNPTPGTIDLNSLGITDGQLNDAIITLKVVDAFGFTATYSTEFSIVDVVPQPTIFSFTPATTGGCGGDGAAITFDATIADPNPSEVVTSVFIDWNWDIFNGEAAPTADEQLTVTTNLDGTFSVHMDHTYDDVGDKFPYLFINAHNVLSGNDEEGIGIPVNPTFSSFPFEQIRAAGVELELTAPDDGIPVDDYTWSVTKDGQPFISAAPGLATFSFTPSDSGVYVTRVVENHDSFFSGYAPFYEDTIIVVGGGTGGDPTATINEDQSDGAEGVAISLSSTADAGCGTIISYAWDVTKDGEPYAPGTPVDGPAFNFTPSDDGDYIVTFTLTTTSGIASDSQAITVSNVDPAVAPISGPSAGVRNQTLSYSSGFTDVSGDADATTSWSVLNSLLVEVASGSGASFNFTPTVSDTYSVRFTVDDLDGGIISATPVSVTVSATMIQSGVLYVGGTTGNDTFSFTPTTTSGEFKLVLNGANQGNFLPTGVQVYGGDGSDAITINGNTDPNTFAIHNGSIVLNGLPFVDDSIESRTINARGNGDSVTVFGGGATITGGSGSDTLTAATGVANTWTMTSLHAGTLNDVAFSSIEVLVGDGTDDVLIGRNSNTTWTVAGANSGTYGSTPFSNFSALQGGSANDLFRVNEGLSSSVSIDGGDGVDKLDYASYASAVVVDLAAETATGFSAVAGIETVAGGDGNDILRGDDNGNTLTGGAGNDIIVGCGGDDVVQGGAGRDVLIGGTGSDTILGNADEDILIAGTTAYDANDVALTALLALWTDSGTYSGRVAAVTNIGNTYHLDGNDGGTQTVFNDSSVDTLTGNAGRDWFFANQDGVAGVDLDIVTDQNTSANPNNNELWNDTDS